MSTAIKVKSEDIEILSPEVEEVIDKEIETSLEKQNVTETLLSRLEKEYGSLKIKGPEDKEGYLQIQTARKDCKGVRVLITKICKAGRAKANAEAAKWIKKEKDLTGRVSKIEDPLEADETAWEAARDAKKAQEALKLRQQGIERTSHMVGFGARLETGNWVLDDISYEAVMVEGADSDIYQGIYDEFKARFDEKERIKKEEEDRQEAARQELKRQQDELLRQQQESRKEIAESRIAIMISHGMKLIEEGKAYAYRDICVQQSEWEELGGEEWKPVLQRTVASIEDRKKKDEEEKVKEQTFKDRLSKLRGWGYNGFTVSRPVDLDGGMQIFGSKEDLVKLSAESFEIFVTDNQLFFTDLEEKKEEKRKLDLENARLEGIGKSRREMLVSLNGGVFISDRELGMLSTEQWETELDSVRKAHNKKLQEIVEQQEKDRQELLGEKQRYEELVANIKAIQVPAFRSGQYRAKANIIRDFIDGLK